MGVIKIQGNRNMGLQTLTGLWKADKGHLSGKTNREIVIPAGRRVFIFKNRNRREGRNDPEYNLVIDDGQDDRQQQGGYQRPAAEAPQEDAAF